MKGYVFSLVNHAHTAATELFDNAVVRDRLADHRAEILGREVGQVNKGNFIHSHSPSFLVVESGGLTSANSSVDTRAITEPCEPCRWGRGFSLRRNKFKSGSGVCKGTIAPMHFKRLRFSTGIVRVKRNGT